MFTITYNNQNLTTKIEKDVRKIKCIIRNRWIILTNEEWVRQHVLTYLIQNCNYPKVLIAVEKKIVTHETTKRFDILVYNQNLLPHLLIEVKQLNWAITDAEVQQVLNYQSVLQARYFALTNGSNHVVFEVNNGLVTMLPSYPTYNDCTIL